MQHNQDNPIRSSTRSRLGRTRVVGLDSTQHITGPLPTTSNPGFERPDENADTAQKKASRTGHLQQRAASMHGNERVLQSEQSTAHLTQLSGMIRAIRKPDPTRPLDLEETAEDGYWPLGIQQVGPLPIVNLYGNEPFALTLPTSVAMIMPVSAAEISAKQPLWKTILASPICKISLGLLAGVVLLCLITRFIDLSQTLHLFVVNLLTFQGIGLGLLAGLAYLAGHAIRGGRWKLFLNSISNITTLRAIILYQMAVFLNFILPMRSGEAAKSLALKRTANIPISKSLPTVAMDKVLDLLVILVLIVLLPLLGISANPQLWLPILVGVLLLALLTLTGLTIWKRPVATGLLQKLLGLLPRSISTRIEGFITGCVDALLDGASRPSIFLPALLLTCLAVACDGLFILLAFRAIGVPISFGNALFGYLVFSIFSILPTPPGQFGSNEALGLLVFSGLLHLPGNQVIAAYLFAHLWSALLLTATGLKCLNGLGLTISRAIYGSDTTKKDVKAPSPSTAI